MTKALTVAEKKHHEKVRELGCIVFECFNPAAIHHIGTGMGGRKDHMRVIPLCHLHHQGKQGIHTLSRRIWQKIYGYEEELLMKVQHRLGDM